jgi:hypothetical protein
MPAESVAYTESADEIVAKASAEGIAISKDNLRDWHRDRLIPKPKQHYPGDGGSVSIYPPGTTRQAIACATLMASLHSVNKVGWALWVRGFPVDRNLWHAYFVRAHEFCLQLWSLGIDGTGSDQFDQALPEIAVQSRLQKPLGQARRRLGENGLTQALDLILSSLVGPREVIGDEQRKDEELIGRLLGTVAAGKKKAIPLAPLLPDSPSEFLGRLNGMADFLPKLKNPELLNEYSDTDFETARNEIGFLLSVFLSVKNAEKDMSGREDSAANFLSELLQNAKATTQAALILMWLICREIPGSVDRLNSLASSIRDQINTQRETGDSQSMRDEIR